MVKGKKMSAKERSEMFKNSEVERRRVFKKLLDHVKAGYSITSFDEMSDHTIKKYLQLYPEEFIEEELDEAKRVAQTWWEDIGRRQAMGSCLGNSRSWIYNMANRFGWRDRQEVEGKHEAQVQVSIIDYSSKKAPSDAVE